MCDVWVLLQGGEGRGGGRSETEKNLASEILEPY